jgi:hypothetical protein
VVQSIGEALGSILSTSKKKKKKQKNKDMKNKPLHKQIFKARGALIIVFDFLT